jgi:arylsulfatase A-like enzyme
VRWALLPALLALTLGAAPLEEDLGPRRPDIVVFLIDDVADSDVDSVPTPVLDALAANGVRFRRAYAHGTCAPSRDSLYRSLWRGKVHGRACFGNPTGKSLDHGALTMAKPLDGVGYETGFFGKWHQGTTHVAEWETTPHLFGWEKVGACVPDNIQACSLLGTQPQPAPTYRRWLRVDDGVATNANTHQTVAMRDAFLQWWQEKRGPDPRFAVLSFQACHKPFEIPPAEILPSWYTPPKQVGARDKFEAMLLSVDFVIGEILQALSPDTWVIVLGDNGTPSSAVRPDQNPNKVKATTFEDGVRVPLIFAGAGLPAGREIDQPVHVVDLLPTLTDALGVEVTAPLAGMSLLPALFGRELDRSWVYVFTGSKKDEAIITRRWKLRRSGGAELLYDLHQDPREEMPLDPTDASTIEIAQRLKRYLATVP